MAVLPAPSTDVEGASRSAKERLRSLALVGAALAVVLVFVPPLWGDGQHYIFVETVQFCLAAFAVPALVMVGRPLLLMRPSSRIWSMAVRLDGARQRHRTLARSIGFVALEVAAVVVWRTPAVVDALVRHRWLVVVEVVSLVVVGIGVWLELMACPPLSPRMERLWRAVLAGTCMWATWIVAYLLAFAHAPYLALRHADAALGLAADQQIAAGVLFFGALLAFMPLVIMNALAWMGSEGDPDAELRRLVRAERRAGRWRGPGG